MGLLLAIPGLVLLLNGVTWFPGENAVGTILVVLGVVLIALQVLATVLGAAAIRRTTRDFNSRF